jgi:hypothetical protein
MRIEKDRRWFGGFRAAPREIRSCVSLGQADRRKLLSKGLYCFKVIELDVGRAKGAAKASFQCQDDVHHRHGIQLFAERCRAGQISSGVQQRADDIDHQRPIIFRHG